MTTRRSRGEEGKREKGDAGDILLAERRAASAAGGQISQGLERRSLRTRRVLITPPATT